MDDARDRLLADLLMDEMFVLFHRSDDADDPSFGPIVPLQAETLVAKVLFAGDPEREQQLEELIQSVCALHQEEARCGAINNHSLQLGLALAQKILGRLPVTRVNIRLVVELLHSLEDKLRRLEEGYTDPALRPRPKGDGRPNANSLEREFKLRCAYAAKALNAMGATQEESNRLVATRASTTAKFILGDRSRKITHKTVQHWRYRFIRPSHEEGSLEQSYYRGYGLSEVQKKLPLYSRVMLAALEPENVYLTLNAIWSALQHPK